MCAMQLQWVAATLAHDDGTFGVPAGSLQIALLKVCVCPVV
jgi:hypothetical protein